MNLSGSLETRYLFHESSGGTAFRAISQASQFAPTGGKLAVISGTCGTAAFSHLLAATGYTDIDGNAVNPVTSSSDVSSLRIAFSATPEATLQSGNLRDLKMHSKDGEICVSSVPPGLDYPSGWSVSAKASSGTASYTILVMTKP